MKLGAPGGEYFGLYTVQEKNGKGNHPDIGLLRGRAVYFLDGNKKVALKFDLAKREPIIA